MPERSVNMIRIINLSKVFKSNGQQVVALRNINLHVQAGEIYGIIGLSGAGKSTLVRCINMLEQPTEGQVIIDGKDLTKLKPVQLRFERRKIGMIFQHFNLLWSRTVFGNVAFPLEIAGMHKSHIQKKVMELLDLVGLSEKAHAYPAQLSGGQKQRVGIARALANDPKVLLCDEATSALDPQTTQSILKLLKDINRKLKITMVIITHEMNVIKEICDTVSVIEDAEIVETRPVIDIFTDPRTATARKFISSVINTDIPEAIKNRKLNGQDLTGILVRLSFLGPSAGEPVISKLVQNHQVQANILYGNIDHIKDTIFGTLTVELRGTPSAIERGLAYLREQNLKIEVLPND